MSILQRARVSVNRNPYAGIALSAALLVVAMAAVERSGILPLEGQAMPMYGPLTVRRSSSSSSIRKRPIVTVRQSSSSSVSLRAAAPTSTSSRASSVSSGRWTGNECVASVHPDATCTAKMKAALEGDFGCFEDATCYQKTWLCKMTREECTRLTIRRWVYDAFFPGCTTKECTDGAAFLASDTSPAVIRTCLDSYVCRELLANFRKGEFACRQYDACLDALTALVSHASCDSMSWCAAMKQIDRLYTDGAKKCTSGPNEDCRTKLGIDAFASTVDRRIPCMRDDAECFDDMRDVAETLGGGGRSGMGIPDAGCFLVSECKKEFEMTKRWACETVKREPDCARHAGVWKLLTETKPACVVSAHTKTCRDAIKAIIR